MVIIIIVSKTFRFLFSKKVKCFWPVSANRGQYTVSNSKVDMEQLARLPRKQRERSPFLEEPRTWCLQWEPVAANLQHKRFPSGGSINK